jgi:hypothetical protein
VREVVVFLAWHLWSRFTKRAAAVIASLPARIGKPELETVGQMSSGEVATQIMIGQRAGGPGNVLMLERPNCRLAKPICFIPEFRDTRSKAAVFCPTPKVPAIPAGIIIQNSQPTSRARGRRFTSWNALQHLAAAHVRSRARQCRCFLYARKLTRQGQLSM